MQKLKEYTMGKLKMVYPFFNNKTKLEKEIK